MVVLGLRAEKAAQRALDLHIPLLRLDDVSLDVDRVLPSEPATLLFLFFFFFYVRGS